MNRSEMNVVANELVSIVMEPHWMTMHQWVQNGWFVLCNLNKWLIATSLLTYILAWNTFTAVKMSWEAIIYTYKKGNISVYNKLPAACGHLTPQPW